MVGGANIYLHPFFINNQKLKQCPKNLQFSGANKRRKLNNALRAQAKTLFYIGNLREMLTFGLASSNVCFTYSRLSTKQLLNNFLGQVFRKS